MADTITVTFGGREVVLMAVSRLHWKAGIFELEQHPRLNDWFAKCEVAGRFCTSDAWECSPKAAFAVVETKLRSLRDELDRVLGETK